MYRPTIHIIPSTHALSGKERISFHADSEAAKLDTEAHLRPNRHGEWRGARAPSSRPGGGGDDPVGGEGLPHQGQSQWGVSLVPPGMDERLADPRLMEAIRRQHGR